MEDFGGKRRSQIVAYNAAKADNDGYCLGWLAERSRRQKGASAVVMGHTHRPRKGLSTKDDNQPCAFDQHTVSCFTEHSNCDFLCPSRPDITTGKGFIFTSPGQKHGGSQLMQVASRKDSYEVEPFFSPPSEWIVERPSLDYSCYVEVENRMDRDLGRDSLPSPPNGYCTVELPELIRAGWSGLFWIQDLPGFADTEGSVTYAPTEGGESHALPYACTYMWPPSSCEGASFRSRSSEGSWGRPNQVEGCNHPRPHRMGDGVATEKQRPVFADVGNEVFWLQSGECRSVPAEKAAKQQRAGRRHSPSRRPLPFPPGRMFQRAIYRLRNLIDDLKHSPPMIQDRRGFGFVLRARPPRA